MVVAIPVAGHTHHGHLEIRKSSLKQLHFLMEVVLHHLQ